VKIDAKTHEIAAESTRTAEQLLKLRERLEAIVHKQRSEKHVGGGRSSLFED